MFRTIIKVLRIWIGCLLAFSVNESLAQFRGLSWGTDCLEALRQEGFTETSLTYPKGLVDCEGGDIQIYEVTVSDYPQTFARFYFADNQLYRGRYNFNFTGDNDFVFMGDNGDAYLSQCLDAFINLENLLTVRYGECVHSNNTSIEDVSSDHVSLSIPNLRFDLCMNRSTIESVWRTDASIITLELFAKAYTYPNSETPDKVHHNYFLTLEYHSRELYEWGEMWRHERDSIAEMQSRLKGL